MHMHTGILNNFFVFNLFTKKPSYICIYIIHSILRSTYMANVYFEFSSH